MTHHPTGEGSMLLSVPSKPLKASPSQKNYFQFGLAQRTEELILEWFG